MRAVVAGCSHWHAARHVAGMARAGARFVGFEDADPAVAEEIAAGHGARAYRDVGEMLDAERPELGLVLGEPARMTAAAWAMVERGIPFVAEKPLGLTSAAVHEIADAVERKGLHAAVAFVNRRARLWEACRELREVGRLGELSHLAVRQINGPPRRYAEWRSGWMLDPARNGGGGALHNLGIHGVDAFLWLTGADPEDVRIDGVTLSSRAHGEAIEDYGVALLTSPDGVRGTIEAGYVFPVLAAGMTRGGDGAWRIAASRAYLEEGGGELRITYPDGSEERRGSDATYEGFCLDAVARVREGRGPLATVRECGRAVRMLERIYAAGAG